MIEIDSLTFTYAGADRPALHDVSLNIAPGEFVAVLGTNGAGKTSLCHALTGYIPHFYRGQLAGRVTLAGRDTQTLSLSEIVGTAGQVFQNPANQISGARLTVYEEVAFGLENLAVPRADMAARIAAALALTGLSALAGRSPYALSGGEQQRLALAAILVMQPRVLVLDEPTSMLDPAGAQSVLQAVAALRATGLTVVLAEHRLEWAAALATRVMVLAEGRIVRDGSPEVVLADPALADLGLIPLRYTQTARLARERGLWPAAASLPVTLEAAVAGFQSHERGTR
ncbi:MAG: ABC transporter ATP-binding protein [Anaerolineales bacterium]|nr:ABC transporter ATP-binding protein [Anaerolineales bacterium]